MYRYLALPMTLWQLSAQLSLGLMTLSDASQENDIRSLRIWDTRKRIELLRELIDGIRPGESPSTYIGLPMTSGRTLDAAAFSIDFNQRHVGDEFLPPFKERIAHGVHAFTEGMAAFWLFLKAHDIAMKPKGVKINFYQPVFLRGKPLRYDIYPPTAENPHQYSIEVHAEGNTINDTKHVVVITIDVESGIMEHDEFEYHLYCGWLISSLLAKKWAGCLFYQLTLIFGETAPKEESSTVTIQTVESYLGKHEQQHHVAQFVAGKATTGVADILSPAKVVPVTEETMATEPRLRLVA